MKHLNYLYIILIVSIISFTVANAVPSINNASRREYVYCPINPTTLDQSTTYEINGCPNVRIYVNNWNTLTPLQQTSIDAQLRGLGFKDPDELGAIVLGN